MFRCIAQQVMIASPGDMADARDAVEQVIHSWNTSRAERESAVLLPMRWETGAVPMSGFGGGQAVINAQLLEKADILIALFGTSAGTPTPAARSGTVEEIDKALERGLPVHVYFSRMPLRHDVDTTALAEVRVLEQELRQRGLIGEFSTDEELRDAVRRALDADTHRLSAESIAGFKDGGGLLRIVGQARSTTNAVLVVSNEGNVMCQDVQITVASGPGRAQLMRAGSGFDLASGESTRLQVLGVQAGDSVRLRLEWREGGRARTDDAAVTFATL